MASGRSLHVCSHARLTQKHFRCAGARAKEWRRMRLVQSAQAGAGQLAQSDNGQSAEGSHAAGGLIPTGGCARILVREGHVTQANGCHATAIAVEGAAKLHRSDGVLPRLIGALTPGYRRVTGTAVAQAKGDGTVKYLDAILLAPPRHSPHLVDFQEELALLVDQRAVRRRVAHWR